MGLLWPYSSRLCTTLLVNQHGLLDYLGLWLHAIMDKEVANLSKRRDLFLNSGPLGAFMSWWIWIPLGRLSYSAYLIHVPVILYTWGMDESERVFTGMPNFIVNSLLPGIFFSYIASIFWSACFEIPFAKVLLNNNWDKFNFRWRACWWKEEGTTTLNQQHRLLL